MGSSSETSYYGPVRNPWDLGAVPGGSSGGSAAAVAARLAPAATGHRHRRFHPPARSAVRDLRPQTDLWRGVPLRHDRFRLQPRSGRSHGEVRRRPGLAAECHGGIRCARLDLSRARREDYTRDLDAIRSRPRVGLPKEYFAAGLDADVARAVEAAVAEFRETRLRDCGSLRSPTRSLSVPAYYVLAPAEASSNLARYDGARYGYRAPDTAICATCT